LGFLGFLGFLGYAPIEFFFGYARLVFLKVIEIVGIFFIG